MADQYCSHCHKNDGTVEVESGLCSHCRMADNNNSLFNHANELELALRKLIKAVLEHNPERFFLAYIANDVLSKKISKIQDDTVYKSKGGAWVMSIGPTAPPNKEPEQNET